ncbi:MAG: glycosyltransferase family 2 protein [Candidatus Micrarchaeaceae archaeon]
MKKPYISIIIPTLNEEANIGNVIKGVKNVLYNKENEIIVVDGYSKDRTVDIAKNMGAKILYDNFGKGSALIKGMHAAQGKILISMDADLSNKPNELLLLIAGIEAGYDVCMGSRFLMGGGSEDMPLIRKFGNAFFVFMVNHIYKTKYTDLCYGYRSFSREAIKKIKLSEKGFGIETEISIKAKKAHLKILEIPSFEKKRAAGIGKLRTFSDGYIILKTIFKNIR